MTRTTTGPEPTTSANLTRYHPQLTRRETLRRGAAVTGIGLTGTTLGGTAAAEEQGGTGFMWVGDFGKALDDDQTFVFVDDDGWTLEHSAGCSGRDTVPTREYRGYLIRFEEGIYDYLGLPTLGHLYVESNRRIELGVWQDVATAVPCPPSGLVTAPWGLELDQDLLKIEFEPTA